MKSGLHGLLAEFEKPDQLLAAAKSAYSEGYREMDAHSPFPVEGVAEAIGFPRTRVATVVLIGGLTGAFVAYGMQYFAAVKDYPLNVGGRPLHSWPSFVPITFELTVLFASLSALIGMLVMNGLPQPYHPLFNAPAFKQASQTRFFLSIQASDPLFGERTRSFLESLHPLAIHEVEP